MTYLSYLTMEHRTLPTLKDLRTARNATQAQLAGRLGIHQTALSRLEGRSDISMSMLKSFVEALGGKLQIAAVFPDTTFSLGKLAENPTWSDLQALVWKQCRLSPMPEDRATDLFLVRRVDESLVELEKISNHQLVEIPIRRVLEVQPETSATPPTIVLRGGLRWSAHEKLWKVVLD
jgi:transcriptional regulator with XRE-family HTH domain